MVKSMGNPGPARTGPFACRVSCWDQSRNQMEAALPHRQAKVRGAVLDCGGHPAVAVKAQPDFAAKQPLRGYNQVIPCWKRVFEELA
ncbi:hypothetical protein GCM10008938_14120 [Deinococcus roseus]|uniref:Uncharacterized protein n=1 Tax=Deinococcus roseus TaxID=392414 RepID=A0ABQ2CWY2_9DEIO|nr:hypothetical protein GCM10008938_14120 [Deinococcus roseus]